MKGFGGEVAALGVAPRAGVADESAVDGALVCPACGGGNSSDAVFCANAECGKALGPFLYVLEEVDAVTAWHERVADRVAAFVGRPHFIATHAVWFAAWLAVNTGLFAMVASFDAYPYNLLGLIISAEAIFLTGFLLISQNRQNAHADKRAQLDYEVNVRTYREISETRRLLEDLRRRLERIERGDNR
jgi:uncharacterized membrane protein